MRYEDIVNKIKTSSGLTDKEIEEKIKKKLENLAGLVSREGAAHIIANELKIKIFDLEGRRLKISELYSGMRSIEIIGKVLKLYDVREFKKENREGKIGSLLVGDETGTVRIVIWDGGLIKIIENNEVKEEDVVKIKNAYVKDNNGFIEVHLGERASLIVNPDGESIESVRMVRELNTKKISELQKDDNVTIIGTVVQVFEPKFYEVCGTCGKRAKFEDGKYSCAEHDNVIPKFIPVLNLFFDDGTGNIRTVAFKDNVAKILDLELDEIREKVSEFEYIKNKILGTQLKLSGRVVKNEMFDRLEFIINSVEEVDVDGLIEELEVKES